MDERKGGCTEERICQVLGEEGSKVYKVYNRYSEEPDLIFNAALKGNSSGREHTAIADGA